MDAGYQGGDMLRRCLGDDPVAEIEDKARLGSRGFEDRTGLCLDGCRRRQQYLRVKIALQSDARPSPRRIRHVSNKSMKGM